MTLYYMKELIIHCQTSVILLGEGEKHGEKEKDHLDIVIIVGPQKTQR